MNLTASLLFLAAWVAAGLGASMFGFFYAYSFSVMSGLDQLMPENAIEAMQSINQAVRNPIFAMSFFGTAPAYLLTAALAWFQQQPAASMAFLTAAVTYACGVFWVTLAVNVPLNNELAAIDLASLAKTAPAIWQDYSGTWQRYNHIRAIVAGAAFMAAAFGLTRLRR